MSTNNDNELPVSFEDITDTVSENVDLRASVRTALLCASMVALGVAVGVNIFTAKMIVTLDMTTYATINENAAALEAYYRTLMHWSLGIFAIASIGVVALDTGLIWRRDED